MRIATDSFSQEAFGIVKELIDVGHGAKAELQAVLDQDQSSQEGLDTQRGNVIALKEKLAGDTNERVQRLLGLSVYLVKKISLGAWWRWLGI